MLQNTVAPIIGQNCQTISGLWFWVLGSIQPSVASECLQSSGSMQHSYLETLLWKNIYHFLERCRNSNNVWLRALMQSDCLNPSLFFEHYNRILLCDWVPGSCSVFSFEGVFMPQNFYTFPGLDQGWTQCRTLDVVLYQALRVSEQ